MSVIKIKRKTLSFILLLSLLTIYYSFWAFRLKFNASPDELMRFLIPNYIYNHGSLPTGYSKEAIYFLGNWSYAFYPQMLGSLTSSFFMKVMSVFSTSQDALLFSARLTSVLSGIIAILFVGLTLYKPGL